MPLLSFGRDCTFPEPDSPTSFASTPPSPPPPASEIPAEPGLDQAPEYVVRGVCAAADAPDAVRETAAASGDGVSTLPMIFFKDDKLGSPSLMRLFMVLLREGVRLMTDAFLGLAC